MNGRWRVVAIVVVVATACISGCRTRDAWVSPHISALRVAATDPHRAALQALAGEDAVQPEIGEVVDRFYAARDHALAWHDRRGRGSRVPLAIEILRSAEAHGLRAAEYDAETLVTRAAASAASIEPDAVTRTARLDRDLTTAVLTLGTHVATGRLDPASLDARWNVRRASPDLVSALAAALESERAAAFLDAVRPVHPEYEALQLALVDLREQARRGWPVVPDTTLRAGARQDAVVALRQRLAVSGYLENNNEADPRHFDEGVTSAVARFQDHHGLRGTGELDRPTLRAMNVPIARRIAEVELNLERWRWLPDDLGARHVLVNIPQFHLFVREGGETVRDIRVVVGRRGNETPTFSDRVRVVVFSPYWNIPESIARQETIPALSRDPSYLTRQNLEIRGPGGEVLPPGEVPWDDEASLRRLSFRQRPGRGNALGFVKFLFPNPHNVYLHDTPAGALFSRVSRAFSHGCVRVEEPERLAADLLRDQPDWDMDRIVSAMHAGTERHVPLADPVPVHIVYFTAAVDAQGGLHHFADVYGYDGRALAERSQTGRLAASR